MVLNGYVPESYAYTITFQASNGRDMMCNATSLSSLHLRAYKKNIKMDTISCPMQPKKAKSRNTHVPKAVAVKTSLMDQT